MIPRSDFLGSVWFRGFDLTTAILSIIGTLYIIIFGCRLPFRSRSMKIIIGIAIGNLSFAISNLLSHFQDSEELKPKKIAALCDFEGRLRILSFCISLVFTMQIAIVSSSYKSNRVIKFIAGLGSSSCLSILIW